MVFEAVAPGWRVETNYSDTEGGRIWVVWDQMVVCGVFEPETNVSYTAIFVYGYNTKIQRRRLWEELVMVAGMRVAQEVPLLVLGDFNQISLRTFFYCVLSASGECDGGISGVLIRQWFG